MFKKRNTTVSKKNNNDKKTKKIISLNYSDEKDDEEDDEELINIIKLKNNRVRGSPATLGSSGFSKNTKSVISKILLEEEDNDTVDSNDNKEISMDSGEDSFKIKRIKQRKQRKDLVNNKTTLKNNVKMRNQIEENSEEEEAGDYSIGNLAMLIKKQHKQQKQQPQTPDIVQSENNYNNTTPRTTERNTAGTIFQMNDSNDYKEIQVFDEKKIDEIKRKKILMRAKLQSKKEREFVTGNNGAADDFVGTKFVTGDDSNEREEELSEDHVADKDKIDLDMGFSDSDSSEDEAQPAIAVAESLINSNIDEFKPLNEVEDMLTNSYINDAVNDDYEDEDSKKKRMEIEDKLYEYELDNGIVGVDDEDNEQLHKWELEKMYHGIKQDDNNNEKTEKYKNDNGEDELRDLLFKKDRMKKYENFPKMSESFDTYQKLKNEENNKDKNMMIEMFKELKIKKSKQVINLEAINLKIHQSDLRIEDLKNEIWEIRQEFATL